MEIPAKVKTGSIGSRKVTLLAALLFATLVAGCYGPAVAADGGAAVPDIGVVGRATTRPMSIAAGAVAVGITVETERGLFGGYAPAHETWAASSRGRTSYGGGGGGHASGGGGGGHASGGGGGGGHSSGGGGEQQSWPLIVDGREKQCVKQ